VMAPEHNEPMDLLQVELIHERPREMFKSFHFQNLQYSRRREPRQVFAPGLITEGVARIGVVSDIHHNTLTFLKVLNIFERMGVNVLFLLGDYAYIQASLRGEDPSDLRFRQFKKVMELSRDYQLKHSAQVVCIMGNHEIESWYFGPASTSQTKMLEMLPTLRGWSFQIPPDPFSGFELFNGCHVVIDVNVAKQDEGLDSRRSFLLAHAISSPLVNAMYQGFPDDQDRAHQMRKSIDVALGGLWADYIDDAARPAKLLWQEFLKGRAPHITNAIKENITGALSFDRLADTFIQKRRPGSEWIDWFRNLNDRQLALLVQNFVFFDDPMAFTFHERLELPKTADYDTAMMSLPLTLFSIGAGTDYTFSGHFHADLGIYNIAERFGAVGIAGAGFQINKTITNELSCYIVEVDTDRDKIYRLSEPASVAGRSDSDVDLTGSLKF